MDDAYDGYGSQAYPGGSQGAPVSDHSDATLLKHALMNEKAAPEILAYEGDLVERINLQLEHQASPAAACSEITRCSSKGCSMCGAAEGGGARAAGQGRRRPSPGALLSRLLRPHPPPSPPSPPLRCLPAAPPGARGAGGGQGDRAGAAAHHLHGGGLPRALPAARLHARALAQGGALRDARHRRPRRPQAPLPQGGRVRAAAAGAGGVAAQGHRRRQAAA
jgi:hypothetical protein